MFLIFIIAVLCVVGKIVALDLEPDLEWDPCKVHRSPVFENLAPPNCKLMNKTKSGQCEYFSCLSTLPVSKEDIGYFRITTPWEPDPGACSKRPRLPAYVRVLDLSYDRRGNFTASIFEDVSDLKNIKSLLLIGAVIISIADDVVGNLSGLECVNLDFYEEPDGHHVLRKFLSVPTLKRLSVVNNHFNPNFFGVLPKEFNHRSLWPTVNDLSKEKFNISLLTQSNLRSLWLSDNDFSEDGFDFSLLTSFPRLNGLDLSKSDLRTEPLIVSNTLDSLDLSGNLLQTMPLLCENGRVLLPELLRLDLSSNKITRIAVLGSCPTKLSFLDLRRNQISSFHSHLFSRLIPMLEILHLEYQSVDRFLLLSSLDFEDAESLWPLRELYLENCNQVSFNGEFSGENEWQFFRQTPFLQKLVLDGSGLAVINEQSFIFIFGQLSHLRNLSLSNTRLQFVSAGAFESFSNLTVLMLRENSITTIPDGCFDSLTQLVHLDLSGNKITTVSILTFSSSLQGRLQAFDLSQNPLTCSCDLMWFRNWFRSDHKLFNTTAHEYKCHNFPRKIPLSDYAVNEQSCLLSREANSMIIFCCSVLITAYTLFILLFRYRWHLRLVLYEAFRGRDDVRRRRLEQGNFDHDVFVSYASEDLNWVRRHLMPQLEDRLHLRLCIHDRQFIPGKNIVDNIADCVEKSKKILMVFTKNFLRSQWCQFELAFCLSHVMEHEDALIILCVDDVVSCEMTSTMMAVLRTTTYIQWENQADAVRSFWGRLELALNEVIPDDEHAV